MRILRAARARGAVRPSRGAALWAALLLFFFAPAAHCRDLEVPFEFQTIRTAHFDINYHKGLEEAALRAASIAESMRGSFSKRYGLVPSERTQIVLVDDADHLSSFSTSVPYNVIVIQTAPPQAGSVFAGDKDWLRSAIAREYASLLAMDEARGYSSIVRGIFGKPVPGPNPFTIAGFVAAAPPNVFLPEWIKKGSAAREGAAYRGSPERDPYTEMVLRMAVLDDRLPSIDVINGETPYWPGGLAPYVFGLELEGFISRSYGDEAVQGLNIRHSGRFPYFLNGAPEGLLGKDYIALYDGMLDELKKRENGDIEAIKAGGLTPFEVINAGGQELTNPRLSPDGRHLAFNRQDPNGHEAIIITGPDGTSVEHVIRRLPSDRVVAWSPDSGKIYYAQEEINSGFYTYQDLYSYDLEKKETKRKSFGLRPRQPDISPDGGSIAFVMNNRADQNLAVIGTPGPVGPVDEKTLQVLTNFKLARVNSPRWSPDGLYIAYSVAFDTGISEIRLFNIKDRSESRLVEGFDLSGAAWTKDGRYIIYSSAQTGVYNLYAYSIKEGRGFRITNLLGGAFWPEAAPGDKVLFSSYGSRGFSLASTGFAPPDLADGAGAPAQVIKASQAAKEPPVNVTGPEPFNALNTLVPRFWLPVFSRDNDGVIAGAYTAGADVLQYNSYQLELDYGAASSRVYYDATYINDEFYPTFTLNARSIPVVYSNFFRSGNYYELNRAYTFKTMVPINRLESAYKFSFGYTWQRQSALSGLSSGRFNGVEVFQGRRSYAFAGVEFTNALKYPLSISEEEGRSLSLLFRNYSKALGSRISSNEYIAAYSEFLRPFRTSRPHDVVFVNLKGGVSAGGRIAQQAFQLGGTQRDSDWPLRGYPARFSSGKYVSTATLEYRAPLGYIFRGLNTKPFFWEKLHGALFTEAGEVWGDGRGFSANKLKTSAGAEARFDISLGYRFKVTPALGVARGFNADGRSEIYFTVYSAF